MKAQKLRELDSNELVAQSTDIHEQLFRLRFQMSMGQTDGLKKYRDAKKDRARMLLILRERNVDVAKAQSDAVAAKPAAKKASPKKVTAKKESAKKDK
jgi:large subunit ribosomal protein L29